MLRYQLNDPKLTRQLLNPIIIACLLAALILIGAGIFTMLYAGGSVLRSTFFAGLLIIIAGFLTFYIALMFLLLKWFFLLRIRIIQAR